MQASRSVLLALLTGLVAVLLLVACGGDDSGAEAKSGSGVAASETREVDSFSSVDLQGFGDVMITIGPEQSVTVETDENLLERVDTTVRGDALEIETDGRLDTDLGIDVVIVVPKLEAVTLSGAGDFVIDGLSAPSVDVVMNGAGNVEAVGTVERLDVSINGAGNAALSDLVASEVDVSINGAGNAAVQATSSLSASINGAGRVTYSGDPEEVETSTQGVGTISKG